MPVVLNLDGNHPKCRVPNDTWRIFIDSEGREDSEGYWDLSFAPCPLDWKQLSKLKKLSDLTFSGTDATIVEFLASRGCTVSTFTWQGSGRSRFDFSTATAIQDLGLDVGRKTLHLKLPTHGRLQSLRLLAPPPDCRATVICPDRGEGMSLMIYAGEFMAIPGLKHLLKLWMFDVHVVDLALVARAYPRLESLEIMGKPVAVRGESTLARLKSLERLSIHECYSMDVAAFPEAAQLPALTSVNFDGLRKEDAQLLKAKYQSVDELDIRGKRTAEWIANNLDNPFRNWPDSFGASVGKQAMAAWKTAMVAIGRLDKNAGRPQSRDILKELVEAFNKLEQRTGLETDQREEIYDAFATLAAKLPQGTVTDKDYDEWAKFA